MVRVVLGEGEGIQADNEASSKEMKSETFISSLNGEEATGAGTLFLITFPRVGMMFDAVGFYLLMASSISRAFVSVKVPLTAIWVTPRIRGGPLASRKEKIERTKSDKWAPDKIDFAVHLCRLSVQAKR